MNNGIVSKNKVVKPDHSIVQPDNNLLNKSRIPGIKFKGERPMTPENKTNKQKICDVTKIERPKTAMNNSNIRFNFNNAIQDQVASLINTNG
jgi:hypothetical protein